MLTKFTRNVTVVTVLCMSLCSGAYSQNIIRPFNLAYSDNIKGNTFMLGNTVLRANPAGLMDSVTNGAATVGNDNRDMVAIDIDGNSD